MIHKVKEEKSHYLQALVERINEKMPGDRAGLCAEFVRQFFGTVAWDDLRDWSLDDAYGAAINFWSMMDYLEPHETKINIYNPSFETNGWQTTHTVIEVICDDMPFIVDSLRMVVNRMGLSLHLIVHMGGIRILRGKDNQINAVLSRQEPDVLDMLVEAPIFIEVDRQTDPLILEELERNLLYALKENRAVVADWLPMRTKVREIIEEINQLPETLDPLEVTEAKAFLNWIEDHHFTFLGIRDFALVKKGKNLELQSIPGTGLGVMQDQFTHSNVFNLSSMAHEARELSLSSQILVISKTNTLACVHRDAYTDYIGVKRFNAQGEVIGERRILGLYTSAAYNTNPKDIPFLRHKVALIFENSNLNPRSHAGRVLMNILETLPRDDLIQASEEDLLNISMGIFHMQERPRIRMFARLDVYHRFISCLVYVPKDRFNTELRKAMQDILMQRFHANEITFSTLFTDSVLARIHFMVRIDSGQSTDFDYKSIEKELIAVGRSWTDDLQTLLFDAFGEERGNAAYARYKSAFPVVYTANFSPRTAVVDIKQIEMLADDSSLGMNFYRALDESADFFRLKIYQNTVTIPLSDVLPIIENLGLRAISERPYEIKFDHDHTTWINEFSMHYMLGAELVLDEIKERFQDAFSNIWFGKAENDGFNPLVLAAGLDWRQVSILRSYAKYFKQICFIFSQEYMESALNNHPIIARKLVQLFELRFDPELADSSATAFEDFCADIFADLESVSNLDEDKIVRQFVHAIRATLRTNYYQLDKDGLYKDYISLKLYSKEIPGVPKPHPLYEIFVYSPRFEAVHLRCSKVARGGLRWSDRKEDFRTEILGLMKAQQVKNSVIVPNGAKGGFVLKRTFSDKNSRDEILAEGVFCYQQFISGLLDITDNDLNGTVVHPRSVRFYDDDDTYLVVAADKGTATFSDIANAISLEYGFWLGDAFASGGSIGYDHKKMAITAKGAFESVKRHFYQMQMDPDTTDFTVIGIGDMSGDVFGNGMLLSKHIKLFAAFNHMHIFVDPTPDPVSSFKERRRMFNLPRSNWSDYDLKCISAGGGVFARNAKFIVLSAEMQALFGLEQTAIEPNELIKIILKTPADLLWSGGVGTFVKATTESNADVGDRSNDLIRINATELNCRSVVEGGNLGLTQLARIEYSVNGGLIYTDFIDNSAGVSCSDKEVNIKILLNGIMLSGDLTFKQRNELLYDMTDDVAKLVLRENDLQTRAISLSATQAVRAVELHSRYMSALSTQGKLDRELEFLPNEKTLIERTLLAQGLTCPEIAVLFCYSKIILKAAILASDIPEDPALLPLLFTAFPKPLQDRFSDKMQHHPLKREIIATHVSNKVVNEMGFSFVYRLQDETGAPMASIARAYMISRSILNMDSMWLAIEALDHKVDAKHQSQIMMVYVRLLRRFSRWFLRNQRMHLDIATTVAKYAPGINELNLKLPGTWSGVARHNYDVQYQEYLAMGVPEALAVTLTTTRGMFAAMDIVDISQKLKLSVEKSALAYFIVGEILELGWTRGQIIAHSTENHWETLSREALRDDLDWQQHHLTVSIFKGCVDSDDLNKPMDLWMKKHVLLIQRWQTVLSNLRSSSALNYTMFFVAIRELLDLTQTTMQLCINSSNPGDGDGDCME